MILQDLIRNYMVYREVLKPLFESWTESWIGDYPKKLPLTPFYKLNIASSKAKKIVFKEGINLQIFYHSSQLSLSQLCGTRTISVRRKLSLDEGNFLQVAERRLTSASPSKETCVLLTDQWIYEFAVSIGKTDNQTHSLLIENTIPHSLKTVNGTTGYKRKQINTFLIFETHEKREYLGEFSLTHEAINLDSFKEGGEHHESNQESVTAIV